MTPKGVPWDWDEGTKNSERPNQQHKEHSPTVLRFFKIILDVDDYSRFLYLPPKFARTVTHLANQETQIEDSSGEKWPVTLSYVKGSLSFKKGWNKFYLDHAIKEGQFLVFSYIKGSHFLVQIFGRSACEILTFNNERPRQKKRARREEEIVCLEEEPVETSPDVNSKDKPVEFMDHQTTEANANCGELQILPISTTNMEEDLTCIISRGDRCYPKEDNFLFDLARFEMEKTEQPDSNKLDKGLYMGIASPRLIGTSELIKEKGDGTETADIHKFGFINDQSNDVFTDKLEKAIDTKSDCSRTVTGSVEQCDKKGDKGNPRSTSIAVNLTNGISGEVFKDRFETKTPPSRTEITGQTKMRGDDTQTTVVRRRPITRNASGVFADKSPPKYSDSMSKGVRDFVSILQNGINQIGQSNSVSPSISSSKIAADGVKREFYESSVSSSVLKDPFGRRGVKKEVMELGEEAKDFSGKVYGKELNFARRHGEIQTPVVKVEPDLPFDTMPPPAISPFSAQVESLSYLELPVHIPAIPGKRRERGRGKVVYLKGSAGMLSPVLYPEIGSIKAFTDSWRRFCKHNGIIPGDRCRFSHESSSPYIFRVDVTRKIGQFPNESVIKVGRS